jgi:hypothetical protein
MDAGYRVASMTSDCGATLDAQNPQIHIAALAADCTLHIAFAPNAVSGSLQGLTGSGLALHLDPGDGGSGEDLPINAGASTFAFATPIAAGNTYTVTLATQPVGPSQTCIVINGSGPMPVADVGNVVIACTTNIYAVGGGVSGLAASGLQLGLNSGAPLAIAADGPFVFPTALPSGSSYGAAIVAQPQGQTCTLAGASGSVTDGDVTSILVTCVTAQPALAASVAASSAYARYGQVVDDVFTLENNGNATAAITVTIALDATFDGANAHLACFGAGSGATCTPDGANPLLYTVTLPPDRRLIWLVSVPVRTDATDATASITFAADNASALDTRTLVIFRDGLDVPYGGGMQAATIIDGARANAILDGDALRELRVPATLDAAIVPLLIVTDGAHEVRVEACSVGGIALVRLFERGADGAERTTPWSVSLAGASLELGSAAVQVEGGDADGVPSRDVVLVGAATTLVLLGSADTRP